MCPTIVIIWHKFLYAVNGNIMGWLQGGICLSEILLAPFPFQVGIYQCGAWKGVPPK